MSVDVVVTVQGQAHLLEVVDALRASGGRSHLLHGWQKQAIMMRDDRDDHQELDQRERRTDPSGSDGRASCGSNGGHQLVSFRKRRHASLYRDRSLNPIYATW